MFSSAGCSPTSDLDVPHLHGEHSHHVAEENLIVTDFVKVVQRMDKLRHDLFDGWFGQWAVAFHVAAQLPALAQFNDQVQVLQTTAPHSRCKERRKQHAPAKIRVLHAVESDWDG